MTPYIYSVDIKRKGKGGIYTEETVDQTVSTINHLPSTMMLWLIILLAIATPGSAIRLHPSGLLQDDYKEVEQHLRRRLETEQVTGDPANHRVTSLPLVAQLPTDFYAGHLPASDDGDKKIFYWLVAPTPDVRMSPNTPLLIWLNGGPGCSSMEGFFLENGPLKFALQNDQWQLVPNPHSWHLAPAWVLYVDQPVGTGLSFTKSGKYAKNDIEVNKDFTYFLEEFLMFHKDLFLNGGTMEMNRKLFFSGESHAGHYIPSMMDFILKKQDVRVIMNLGGAAIGNGWIDPYHQYSAAEAAYGMGLISLGQKSHLDALEKECHADLDQGFRNSKVCYDLLDLIIDQSHGSSANTQISMYDFTKFEFKGRPRSFPEGHEIIEAYLGGLAPPQKGNWNSDFLAVLEALHATESIAANQHYQECTDPPYYALADQDGQGVTKEITALLEAGVPLLFFNGMRDLICNHIGTDRALLKLPWSQAHAWAVAGRSSWALSPGKLPVAYVQEHASLSYLKVLDSGHMVPKDQPEVALAMMHTFLYGKSFQTSVQQLDRDPVVEAACR
jgi:carboxypeptidase D